MGMNGALLFPLLEAPPEHRQPRGVLSSGALCPASLATLGESRGLWETRWEWEAEPGQRSGSQALCTRIETQILEFLAPGQRKRWTQKFRGPEPVVGPRGTA